MDIYVVLVATAMQVILVIDMVTKVKCVTPECHNYEVKKSVASAGVMQLDYRKCVVCRGKMVAAERIKPVRKPPTRSPSRRGGRRGSGR
jgi:hypothetical protein